MMQYDRDRTERATRFMWAAVAAGVTFLGASGWAVGMYAAVRIVSTW